MEYKSRTEPVIITQSLTNDDLKEELEIKRTRRKLFILLSIELVVAMTCFIQKIKAAVNYNKFSSFHESVDPMAKRLSIFGAIGSGLVMVFYIFFLFIVYKYLRIGILISAWISIIHLIGTILSIIIEIIAIPAAIAKIHDAWIFSIVIVTIIVVGTAIISLLIMIIIYAFKLVNLIETSKARFIV